MRTRRLPVSVTASASPSPGEIAGYLAQIAVRLDERPEPMRIVFDVPRGTVLDSISDGRLAIGMEGHRRKALDLRRRWIADHPMPLSLHRRVLYVDPVDANRFRVFLRPLWRMPAAAYAVLSLIVTAVVVLFLWR